MKNFIITSSIVLGMLFFSGCGKVPNLEDTRKQDVREGRMVSIHHYPDRCDEREFDYYLHVRRFEFDGHKYIIFGEGRCSSIVHDPDCDCNR